MNWLPPTEPNGEVHYVVEYKREDSGNWTSVNTTSDSTYYNLTRLHSGTSYTIRVVAVNSAGRAPITPTPTSSTAEPTPTFNSTGEDDKRDRRGGRQQRMTAHMHMCVKWYRQWLSPNNTLHVSHMSHVLSSYTYLLPLLRIYRWCTTGSTDRCSGGLPAPHTAHCWDHCWSSAVGKKGTQEENVVTEECTAAEG